MPRKKSAAKRAREQAKKEAAVPATDTATIKTSETSATTVKPAIEARDRKSVV